MEKVMQPKKIIRLTEAEKKIISEYSAYTAYANASVMKPLHADIIDKKIIKWLLLKWKKR